jgi:hypothetical protein
VDLRGGSPGYSFSDLVRSKIRQRADDFLRGRIVNGKLCASLSWRNFGLRDGGHGES